MGSNLKRITSVILVVLVIGMMFVFSGCSGSDERDVAECGVCGKRYYAGDAGGNYMKIAYSGMCKKCYSRYKEQKELRDYYELN